MKLTRYLLLGLGFLVATAVIAAAPLLSPFSWSDEPVLQSLATAIIAVAGVSMASWALFNELIGLARPDSPAMARPARFVRPQTGTPEVTAFG